MPNVLSPRDLVSRPDNMEETVLSSGFYIGKCNNDGLLGNYCLEIG